MDFSPFGLSIFKVRDIYINEVAGEAHGSVSWAIDLRRNTLMGYILKKSSSSLPGTQGQASGNYKTLTFCSRILCI